jgi:N-acetylneuraminic acid mutarotase
MKQVLLFFMAIIIVIISNAQNVGIGTTTPNSSAILDVSSTTKGMLMPRMSTSQRNAIVGPVAGLAILNTDDKCIDIYDGTNWIKNCGYKQGDSAAAAADSWIQKPDFGGVERKGAVGFSIGNKGYIGTGESEFSSALNDFWELDPSTNVWTQKANFGGGARTDAVGFSIGSKGYIGTGSGTRDFWEYDPVSNLWTQKANFGGLARNGAVGFSIGSKGYLGTGITGIDDGRDFWEYDPANNQWTQKANFAGTRRAEAVGFSIGNKGYIATGSGNGGVAGVYTADCWEYNSITNIWTQIANIGGDVEYSDEAVGFSIGSKGYVGTGSSNYYSNEFWEYNPSSNTWIKKADFKGRRRIGAVGFSIGSKGYIATGKDIFNLSLKNDFWEYNTAPYNVTSYSANTSSLTNANITDGIWTKKYGGEAYSNVLKIGIGTTTPATAKLVIGGTNGAEGIDLSSSDQYANMRVIRNSLSGVDKDLFLGYQSGAISSLHLYSNNNETVTVKDDKVGIGTTTPTSKLTVSGQLTVDQKAIGGYGGLLLKGNVPGNNYPNIAFTIKNNAATPTDMVAAMIQGDLQNNAAGAETIDLTFLTSQTGLAGLSERFRIKGNGNVGIGVSSPGYKLHLGNAINGLRIEGPATAASGGSALNIGGQGDVIIDKPGIVGGRFVIKESGNVGIGTATPSEKLHVIGNILSSGTITPSDFRYKKDILDITNPLEKVMQLRGVTYNLRSSEFPQMQFDTKEQIGLIAQEVEKVLPSIVHTSSNGYKGVAYEKIVPLLIEGMKEQQKQIELQQKQIDELKGLVQKLVNK